MFPLDYPETPDGLAPTDSVSASTGSYSLVSDSNPRGTDNGLVSPFGTRNTSPASKGGGSDTAGLQDAGEVDSTTQGSDGDFLGDFCPHILHEPHIPVPIAMVNRRPTGSEPFHPTANVLVHELIFIAPGHYSVRHFPQDIAWLSAMHYAQKTVFMFVSPLRSWGVSY